MFNLRSLIPLLWSAFICLNGGYAVAGQDPKVVLNALSGSETVVFDWQHSRCADEDVPDAPLRAFRDSSGQVRAFASHYIAWPFVGENLVKIKRDCSVAFRSADNPDPSAFAARTWIMSTYTTDGIHIFALGHNEYQAQRYPGRCKYTEYTKCWYNSVVSLSSMDGGKSFSYVSPGTPVIAPNFRQDESEGSPMGFFGGSNMVSYKGYVYATTSTRGGGGQNAGVCMLRTKDPADVDSWQILAKSGWSDSRTNIYKGQIHPNCLTINNLHGGVTSIVQIESKGIFVALYMVEWGKEVGTVSYSTSTDLINWSAPVSLFKPMGTTGRCKKYKYLYPSLMDPNAKTRNFQDVGSNTLLFLSRIPSAECGNNLDRDLVSFKVIIK